MKWIEKLAVKLYTDVISLKEFTEVLYSDDVVDLISSNEFVYDLIDINFKSNDSWKYKLKNTLEKHISENELLCELLKCYSLEIISTNDLNTISLIIEQVICYDNHENDIRWLSDFSYLNYELKNLRRGKISANDEIKFKISCKKLSREFLEEYDNYEIDKILYGKRNILELESDYDPFLRLSEGELIEFKKIRLENEKEEYKKSTIIYILLGIIKTYVGIIALEKGIFMYAFLVLGIAMLITSFYYVIKLINVNKKLNKLC